MYTVVWRSAGQAAEQGSPGEFGLVADTELGSDAFDVGVDGVRTDAQPGSDLAVGETLRDLAEHLLLPLREVVTAVVISFNDRLAHALAVIRAEIAARRDGPYRADNLLT